MGGLGNQLFQYANALMLNPEARIIATKVSTKTLNDFAIPEVVNYASLDVDNHGLFKNRLSIKFHNMILRNSSFENRHPGWKSVGAGLQRMAVYFLGFLLGKAPMIYFQSNLGFQPRFNKSIPQQLLQIGYFQHAHWLSDIRVCNKLFRLSLPNPSPRFLEIANEFKERKILVLHMRFGDYLNEKLFGLPTLEYFERAITLQLDTNNFDKIVVFTNGERNALELLDSLQIDNAYIVSNHEPISDSETLELMRLGSGYVLSNSTFGWWGAFLSRQQSAPVICPTPWFQGMIEPKELIPSHWHRIPI